MKRMFISLGVILAVCAALLTGCGNDKANDKAADEQLTEKTDSPAPKNTVHSALAPIPTPTASPSPQPEESLIPAETEIAAYTAPSTPAPTPTTYALGMTQVQNDIAFTLNSVSYVSNDVMRDPTPGNVYLLVELKVKNNSNLPQTLSSLLCYSLVRTDDPSYAIEPTLTASQRGNLDETIQPGDSITGEVAFEVQENYRGYLLRIRTDMMSENALIFDLSSTNGASDSAPDKTADIWAIGDTADIGRQKYVVSGIRSIAASQARDNENNSELILVAVTVINPMDVPFRMEIGSVFALVDELENEYSPTANVSATPLPEGDVLPGQSISGEISFIVPSGDYNLRIMPEVDSDEIILFSLVN